MRTRRIVAVLGATSAVVVGGAVQASAHPTGPPLHNHVIVMDPTDPTASIPIGPRVCGITEDDPNYAGLHQAFHQFHSHVHAVSRTEPATPNQAFMDNHGHPDYVTGVPC